MNVKASKNAKTTKKALPSTIPKKRQHLSFVYSGTPEHTQPYKQPPAAKPAATGPPPAKLLFKAGKPRPAATCRSRQRPWRKTARRAGNAARPHRRAPCPAKPQTIANTSRGSRLYPACSPVPSLPNLARTLSLAAPVFCVGSSSNSPLMGTYAISGRLPTS